MTNQEPFNPDEHRWLPADTSRVDTGPVIMTREEFEQAVADGIARPVNPVTAHWSQPDADPIRDMRAAVGLPRRCPECMAGKHGNCDGTTWDPALDERVTCPCTDAAHDQPGTGHRP